MFTTTPESSSTIATKNKTYLFLDSGMVISCTERAGFASGKVSLLVRLLVDTNVGYGSRTAIPRLLLGHPLRKGNSRPEADVSYLATSTGEVRLNEATAM